MKSVGKHMIHYELTMLKIFNCSIKCKFFDKTMPIITYLGSLQFSFILCLLTLISSNTLIKTFGINITASLIICTSISWFLKLTISRVRPYNTLSNLSTKKISVDNYSFPSAHASAAFAIGVMSCFFFPSLSLLWISLSLLTALSRMYLGVHYPTDVLAGIIIGIVSSYLTFYFIVF